MELAKLQSGVSITKLSDSYVVIIHPQTLNNVRGYIARESWKLRYRAERMARRWNIKGFDAK